MATPNPSLRELQAVLVKNHGKLNQKLDEVTNLEEASAIVREMQEVTHRITLIGQLLFAKGASALRAKVDLVKKATTKVNQVIQTFKNVQELLDAMTDLLTLVDDAIDLAKTFA